MFIDLLVALFPTTWEPIADVFCIIYDLLQALLGGPAWLTGLWMRLFT